MAKVPGLPDWSGGGTVPTTQLNQITSVSNFLLTRPVAQARQSVAQSIPLSVFTALNYDLTDVDSNLALIAQHSVSVSTSQLTCAYAGKYRIWGRYVAAANATGLREARIAVNSTPVNGSVSNNAAPNGVNAAITSVAPITVVLGVGDFAELQVFQSSGGALLTGVAAPNQSMLAWEWISN